MSILDNYDPGDDLLFLAETDVEAAQLKRAVEATVYVSKKTKDIEFESAQGSVELRKALAGASDSYEQAMEKYFDAIETSEALQNKRKTAQLRIDVWRSVNANRRQG